jgi:hypothetical protein
MSKDFDFDKFMQDIVVREQTQAERVIDWQRDQDQHPARIYNEYSQDQER